MTQLFGTGMPFHHGLFHAEKKKVKRACGNGNKSAMRDASTLTVKRAFFMMSLRWLYFNQRTPLNDKTKFRGDYRAS